MGTPNTVKYLPHARPHRVLRFDARWITVGLMVASAVLMIGVLWVAFALLLSLAEYIPSQVAP